MSRLVLAPPLAFIALVGACWLRDFLRRGEDRAPVDMFGMPRPKQFFLEVNDG